MSLLEPRKVSGRSSRSPFRLEYTELKSSGGQGCPCFQAGFMNVLVKCCLCLFGLVKLSPERYFSRCGAKRERKGKTPARGRCTAKRSLPPTLLARSSVQEDATPRRGRLLPGTFCQILVDGRPGSWLSARRPLLVLPRSLHGKLLLANWRSDFTTSYAFSGLDPHTINRFSVH